MTKLDNKVNNEIERVISVLNRMKIINKTKSFDDFLQSNNPQQISGLVSNNNNLQNGEKADILFLGFLQTQEPKLLYKTTDFSNEYKPYAFILKSLIENAEDNPEWCANRKAKLYANNSYDKETLNKFFKFIEISETDLELFSDLDSVHRGFRKQDQADNSTKGWFNNQKQINVKIEDTIEIMDFEGSKLFGLIPKEQRTNKFQEALNNGYAVRAKACAGVKNIENKLFEIKQLGHNASARLYTKELYQNSDGDYLAIFNKEGNHEKIKNVTNKSKGFDIFECLSSPTHSDFTNGFDHEITAAGHDEFSCDF